MPGSVGRVFHLDLPLEARVCDIRSTFGTAIDSETKILAKVPGEGCVTLGDMNLVPCKITLSSAPAFPILGEIVLTQRQGWLLQDLFSMMLSRPAFQKRLDELEIKAGKMRARYRVALAEILNDEVYPALISFFGLARDIKGPAMMFSAILHAKSDELTLQKALELEMLMRNEDRAKWIAETLLGMGLRLPAGCDHSLISEHEPVRAIMTN